MIKELCKEGDVLLIVPPFGSVEIQALAAHTLQACARDIGSTFEISYLNLHFAAELGDLYRDFCKMNYFLLGERVFARAAWEDKVNNQINKSIYNYKEIYNREENPVRFFPVDEEISLEQLQETENIAYNWIKSIEDSLKNLKYSYIGITSSFEQTNAAIALFKIIKKHNPHITTFIGGFNCEKNIALGIESLDPNREFIDYIFSGESEDVFVDFLKNGKDNKLPKERIIKGTPVMNMDKIPNLDYSDYFTQLERWLPHIYENKDVLNLAMETSRGCWWGEKCQCSFCGTSDRVKFREKSTKRILEELKAAEKWNIPGLHMADLIMPEKNLTELLPTLIESKKKWTFYYEQKVSLTLKEMRLIKDAGIIDIQPGIESLSTSILQKMGKGTSLKQNLRFLRDATYIRLNVFWNIVWGVPGEKISEYKKINELIPMINHLIPPIGLFHMTLVKFSPYFSNAKEYGITNIKPIPSYAQVFPKETDVNNIAIIHSCKYEEETIEDLTEIEKLVSNVETWNARWQSELTRPRLQICKQGNGKTVLLDTRGLDLPVTTELNSDQIRLLIDKEVYTGNPNQIWALESKVAILENNEILSLAIADEEIRREYENRS